MLDRIKGLLGIGSAPLTRTPGKRARKVALVDVKDCCRATHDAYWQIGVTGTDELGYRWQAKIMAYEPVGWDFRGKVTKDRPKHAAPVYPSDAHLMRQTEFQHLEELARTGTDEQVELARARIAQALADQDAFRVECRRIYEAHPKPVYLVDEEIGVADTKDQADTAAQEWVRERMKGRRRPKAAPAVAGYAIPLPLDPLGEALRDLYEELRHLWRKFGGPLLALGINGTTRNNMLTQIETALDAGAGAALWRIYDGTRPATCGTATTLGAELTCSDPAGSVASQVLTFSAITADASANASITASWFRLVDSTGTCVHDGNVGTAGSDLNLNSTTITAGQEVSISSATITAGNP